MCVTFFFSLKSNCKRKFSQDFIPSKLKADLKLKSWVYTNFDRRKNTDQLAINRRVWPPALESCKALFPERAPRFVKTSPSFCSFFLWSKFLSPAVTAVTAKLYMPSCSKNSASGPVVRHHFLLYLTAVWKSGFPEFSGNCTYSNSSPFYYVSSKKKE